MKLLQDTPPEGTVRDWIDARAESGGTGFVFPEGEEDLGWSELRATARRIASALTQCGTAAGDSVAIMMPNGRSSVECLFGVLYGGFKATMINLAAGPDAIAYALEHSEAGTAFVGAAQQPLFSQVSEGLGITQLDPSNMTGTSAALHPVTAQSAALLMYTSGTTGRPKGVVHSQSSLLAGGWTTAIAHRLTPDDRGLCVLPICHINGLCVSIMGTLVSGGSLAMVPKFSASRFWTQADVSRASWFSVVPTIISHLLHAATGPSAAARARLRFGRSASSALAPDVQRAFEDRFGVPVIETMGLTETAAQILSNPLPPGLRKIGSPGIAYGNEAAIFTPDLAETARGEEGELVVRGPNVMSGYLNNPEATNASFAPGGWLRTGDLGRQDEDGYIFITGRLKELIIKGGENIAPREIDEALYAHPDVVEAAAFSCPCPDYGERVEAAVALRADSVAGESDLLDLCRLKLGAFKTPDKIHFLAELPKGPSGKIQRMKLQKITLASA